MKKTHKFNQRSKHVTCSTPGCQTFIKLNVLERKIAQPKIYCYKCYKQMKALEQTKSNSIDVERINQGAKIWINNLRRLM